MADLTFLIKETTIGKTDAAIETDGATKPRRSYLGMSEIGDTCARRLWLKAHTDFQEPFSGRLLRLFETGHIIERRVIRDLRRAGFIVGGRQKVFKDFKGKFKGHCDGIVGGLVESGQPHILEIKSANEKGFKAFKEKGIESAPKYAGQVQLYMGYAKLKRALFIVECKNTSERVQERIKFDAKVFELLREKARLIIEAKTPPTGISSRPDWWECKMCPLNNDTWCRKDWEVKSVETGRAPF